MKLSGRVVPPRRTGKRLTVQLRQTNCQRQRILRLSNRQHNRQIADCGLKKQKTVRTALYVACCLLSLLNPQSEICTPQSRSSADMHNGSALRVFFGLPEHFARHGRGVAFTEDDVTEQILQRVALAPTEIDVRHLAGRVAQMEQKRSDGVRHG